MSSNGSNDQNTKMRSTHLMEVVDRVREMHVQKSSDSSDASSVDLAKRRREDAVEADDEDAGMSTSSDDEQPLDFSSKKSKKNKSGTPSIADQAEVVHPSQPPQSRDNRSMTPPIRQQLQQYGSEGFIGNLLQQHNNRQQLCSDGNSDRSSESSPRRNSPLPNMNAAAALLSAVTSQTPSNHPSFQHMAAAAVNALASPALNNTAASASSSPEMDVPTGLLTTVPHDYRAIGFLRAAALLRGHNKESPSPAAPAPQTNSLEQSMAERPKMSADLQAFLNGGKPESKFEVPIAGPSGLRAAASAPTASELMELHRVKNESDSNFLQYRSNMMSQIESTRPKGRRSNNNRTQNNDDKHRDPGYVERRKKNNEAAKRSRDARRTKENEIAVRAQFLETENGELKVQLASLRSEIANLRIRIYGTANPPNHNGPIV